MTKILILALFLFCTINSAHAATTVYDTEAEFLVAIGDDPFLLEDFNTYTDGSFTAPSLSLGPLGFLTATLSAPSGLFSLDGLMSTNASTESITINFTGNARAVGGRFFGTDFPGDFEIAEIILTLSDGSEEIYNPANATEFKGFVSNVAISSMTIATSSDSAFVALDDFYMVAVAAEVVPTLSITSLVTTTFGLMLLSLIAIRRRT